MRGDSSRGSLELAPAVVVRIAGWPLGAITCLGGTGIHQAARAAGPSRSEQDAYAAAHARAVDDERARLWARTAGDPRFVRALALANPELARSLVGTAMPASRNKRARHLETTLYRYLARAVSRTQPGDLWTTVTLASWGPRRSTTRTSGGRCLVAPDLAPLRGFVLALAGRAPYPERQPYKLNPTLARQADGAWLLWTAPGRQPGRQRRLGAAASVDAIVEVLGAEATWTRPAAAAAVARKLGASEATARRTIDMLCDQGVLVGGLAFPRRFRDAWQALAQVEAQLEPEHAAPWRHARLQLRTLADGLRASLQREDGEAVAVLDAMDAARVELATLAAALGIDGVELPRAALRCDVESPWRVVLGPDDAAALERSIDAYLRYQADDGLYSPLVRAALDRTLQGASTRAIGEFPPLTPTFPSDGVVTWDAVLADHAPDGELRRRCARVQQRLDHPGAELRVTPTGHAEGPLLAALHCSLATPALGGEPVVHGLGIDATAAYSRFSTLLDGEPTTAPEGFEPWIRRCNGRLRERTGAEPVALLYDHATPNVMAQPELWGGLLDPWGITAGARSDRGLRLELDPSGERLWVRTDADPQPAVVVAPTAANPRLDDPCLHALLLSSMHVPPLSTSGMPILHRSELEAPRHRPRLRLHDGTVVQPRRTVLPRAVLEPLLRTKGAARFAKWQQLAAAHEWPALLLLEHEGKAPLLVHRDSPLAIDAAFEGASGMKALLVEELSRDAWIADGDDDDHAYLADLVLPFARDLDVGRLALDLAAE